MGHVAREGLYFTFYIYTQNSRFCMLELNFKTFNKFPHPEKIVHGAVGIDASGYSGPPANRWQIVAAVGSALIG